jgi:hypothetical protein
MASTTFNLILQALEMIASESDCADAPTRSIAG